MAAALASKAKVRGGRAAKNEGSDQGPHGFERGHPGKAQGEDSKRRVGCQKGRFEVPDVRQSQEFCNQDFFYLLEQKSLGQSVSSV